MNTQYLGLAAITIVCGMVHRSTIAAIVGDDANAVAILASGVSVDLQHLMVLQ